MRKNLGLVALAIAVLVTMLSVFVGCSNEIDGPQTGSLTISDGSRNVRTISPAFAEIEIVSYKVNGVYSDTSTTFAEVTSTSSDITVENLLVGDWTITLDGLNENGVVIATKTQIVTIYERQNTAATFYLELFSGTGTVSIAIQWSSNVNSFTQIKGTITPVVTGKEGFLVAASKATPLEGGFKSINQVINEFPTGSYQFKLEFLDEENNSVGLSYREALNVYNSLLSSKEYSIPEAVFPIETPSITINNNFWVSISCATSGVQIYYTTNGSEPTISSSRYTLPFPISKNITVKAIAVREDRLSSAIGEEFLEVPAATPTFSLDAGMYDSPRTITLNSATSGAIIYYSLDGTTPTESSNVYIEPIVINENTTVKAYAVHPNHSNSSVSSAEYKIQAGKPAFSLKEGSYTGTQTLVISSATDGATIYYTTDGSLPTNESQVYSSAISLTTTTTVNAYAVKENMESSAFTQSVYYLFLYDPVSPPILSTTEGTFEGPQIITITTETEGATIYYTLDGNEPIKTSNQYSVPISISENTTIKAYAIKDGAPDSATTSGTYLIKPFAPTFSILPGTYMESKAIEITSVTAGASIFYTLDGSIPTSSSCLYSKPITINSTTSIKAIAVKNRLTDSNVALAEYVIAGSSGLKVVNPANYSVSIQLPEGWEKEIVVKGAGGTITASVTPNPKIGGITYAWYLDGAEMSNNDGTAASTTDTLKFGIANKDVTLQSGPHVLMVEVTVGNMVFSDQKVIAVSKTGTVGVIDSYQFGEAGPAGGYVFYDKGSYSNGWRYLEAAPSDISYNGSPIFGLYLNNGVLKSAGTQSGIGTGQANTAALVAKMGNAAKASAFANDTTTTGYYAARLCDVYAAGGYSDWFLPSKDELNLMYKNLGQNNLGGFYSNSYWSSTESDATNAYYQSFSSGNQSSFRRDGSCSVRPIRAF